MNGALMPKQCDSSCWISTACYISRAVRCGGAPRRLLPDVMLAGSERPCPVNKRSQGAINSLPHHIIQSVSFSVEVHDAATMHAIKSFGWISRYFEYKATTNSADYAHFYSQNLIWLYTARISPSFFTSSHGLFTQTSF